MNNIEMNSKQPSNKSKSVATVKSNPMDTPKFKFVFFEETIKPIVEKFMEHPAVIAVMSLFTIWALFSDSIRLAGTSLDSDLGFEVAISIAFFLFLLEIFFTSMYKPEYINIPKWQALEGETYQQTWIRRMTMGSFFFWLDWVATLSLVFDVSYFKLPLNLILN